MSFDFVENRVIEEKEEIVFYGHLSSRCVIYSGLKNDFSIIRISEPFMINGSRVNSFMTSSASASIYKLVHSVVPGIYKFRGIVQKDPKYQYKIILKDMIPYIPEVVSVSCFNTNMFYVENNDRNGFFTDEFKFFRSKFKFYNGSYNYNMDIDFKALEKEIDLIKDNQNYKKLYNSFLFGIESRASYENLKKVGVSEKKIFEMLVDNLSLSDKFYELFLKNPYKYLIDETKGYSFAKCDNFILKKFNIKYDDVRRIQSACVKTLLDYQNEGHCYMLKNLLVKKSKNYINVSMSYKEMVEFYSQNNELKSASFKKNNNIFDIDIESLKKHIDAYNNEDFYEHKNNYLYKLYEIEDKVLEEKIDKAIESEFGLLVREGNKIYEREIYDAEISLSKKIKTLIKYKEVNKRSQVEKILDEVLKEKDIELEDMQRKACIEFSLYDKGLFILTGGPGTGKTFVLEIILEIEKRLNSSSGSLVSFLSDNPILLAPTGKAAKVLEESVKMAAHTIHSQIGREYFSSRLIVCDEVSMVDVKLCSKLFSLIENNRKVILIGDINQIPSIGPGNCLRDFLDANKIFTVKLNIVKRQSKIGSGKGIIENIDNVLNGRMIESKSIEDDFYIINKDKKEDIINITLRSINNILKKFPTQTLEDVQVLTPRRTGELGADVLNYYIQEKYNKVTNSKSMFYKTIRVNGMNTNVYFKLNDIVMQIRNNYSKVLYDNAKEKKFFKKGKFDIDNMGVFNGETGKVVDIKIIDSKEHLVVKFNNGYAFYSEQEILELDLAYAITVHKSQGSSLNSTILIVSKEHENMWYKNLLYTALSRSKKFSVVIGDNHTIEKAILNEKEIKRLTTLKNKIIA